MRLELAGYETLVSEEEVTEGRQSVRLQLTRARGSKSGKPGRERVDAGSGSAKVDAEPKTEKTVKPVPGAKPNPY